MQSKFLFEQGTEAKDVANKILEILKEENPLPRYPVGELANMFAQEMKRKTPLEFEQFVSQAYADVMDHNK